ncbi:MAG: hypothetical protein IKZ88_01605 [Neisseriaceae bacterium]|nr:hypothetical protein [Neisseriaceae bacterium]
MGILAHRQTASLVVGWATLLPTRLEIYSVYLFSGCLKIKFKRVGNKLPTLRHKHIFQAA